MGLVSRVTPVQTAMRNCTRDEGMTFEVGNRCWSQATASCCGVKSHGGERCGKPDEIPAGKIERGERKRTVAEVSKAD